MFTTFIDWSIDNPEEGVKTANKLWLNMKASDTLKMQIVKTDDTGASSINIWPDRDTARKAIHAIREKGASMSGTEIIDAAM